MTGGIVGAADRRWRATEDTMLLLAFSRTYCLPAPTLMSNSKKKRGHLGPRSTAGSFGGYFFASAAALASTASRL